ncbi:MAG TPA: ABC transporter permease [Thermoplasmata archaeon]|nr:ABC transporter permease [Thermoplasmata archaeon]
MEAPASAFPNVPTRGRALPAFLIVGWRWIGRNPAVAVAPILLPFIFLYFLSFISPPSLLPLEIVGAMLFTMQNIGSWVLGDSAVWRIECSIQDLFVASPLGRLRYLFGIAFSNLIAMLPALAILTVLLAWIGGADGYPLTPVAGLVLAASLAILWVLFSAIGMAISSRIRTQREIWPVGNLTFTILGMLSPLYYPLSALPPVWQHVARFLPTTYAALLAQGALGITPATPLQLLFYGGLLVACAAVGLTLTLRLYRWGEA